MKEEDWLEWQRECHERETREMEQDAEELAHYRAMFPVDPWDDGPVTAEVCERLGMEIVDARYVFPSYVIADLRWSAGIGSGDVEWWEPKCGQWEVLSSNTTAGQLACLVAARRAR